MTLILPGDPLFDFTLATTLPPGEGGKVYIARSGSGILDALDPDSPELADYIYGGEYDERLIEIGEEDDEWDYS